MQKERSLVIGAATCVMACGWVNAATLYVKATGTGNCTTWANACSLGTALANADPLTSDQIWVQAGTYTATVAPFELKNGVKVIGGFAGTETVASQSNPTVNVTILDGATARPCVTNLNANPGGAAAVLRGFTLRNGRDTDGEGGALVLQNSNAIVVSCTFEENSAGYFGGAVFIRGIGSPQFFNCIFRNNGTAATNPRDTLGGGGVFVDEGAPLFANCLFYNNEAGQGGVMLVRAGYPTVANCTMTDNRSVYQAGGAISDPNGGVTLKNSIVWSNTRMLDPDGAGPDPAVPVVDQVSCSESGTSLPTYCDIQGGWSIGSNNINSDPLFTNSGAGDYTLTASSPGRDTGFNYDLPADAGDLDWDGNTIEAIPKDLNMNPRKRPILNGIVDMGAYERQVDE